MLTHSFFRFVVKVEAAPLENFLLTLFLASDLGNTRTKI
jgi:hypothetical protein